MAKVAVDNCKQLHRKLMDTKGLQLSFRDDFLGLFEESFGRSMGIAEWEHFYLKPPYGQTRSFAFYDGSSLAAHGGLIPQQLVSADGARIDFFLQTAVMVQKKYQSVSLFKELLDWMDSFVSEKGAFSLCFPNQASYLPFVKLLRWKMIREYSIHQFELVDPYVPEQGKAGSWGMFQYRLAMDQAFIAWRGELIGLKFHRTSDFTVGYKEYQGSMEIMDIDFVSHWTCIPLCDIMRKLSYTKVNVPGCYLDVCSLSGLSGRGTIGIPQRMCLFPYEHAHVRYDGIKPSLLLSDVF